MRVKVGLVRIIVFKVVIVVFVWSCGVVCCWGYVDKLKFWVDCWLVNWWINGFVKFNLFVVIKLVLIVRVVGSFCVNGVNIFK